MSGARKIDDHAFFAGKMSKESVLPKGVHVKSMDKDYEGGHLRSYEDQEKDIEMTQRKAEMHLKKHSQKEDYKH